MSQKTIIYIGSLDLPDRNAGANRAWVVGKLLRDCGYNIVLIGVNREINVNEPILETKREIDGFTCYVNPRQDFLISIRSIVKVIETLGVDTIEAVVGMNYPAFPLNNLRRYCKKNGISFIADCTEWYPVDHGNLAYRLIKWLDIVFRMRYVHRKTKNIICISRFLENYYQKQGCNTFYLPTIVDKQDAKWLVAPYPYAEQRRRFVFAGRAINDRLELLIAAFNEIMVQGKSFEFHIFGITKDHFLTLRPEYRERLDLIDKCVFFHGNIPHIDVIRHIKACDFTVFLREKTRTTEAGFPTKLIESFACGIPPITNKTSDIADFLKDGENGFLIEHYDFAETKQALMRALNISEQQLNQIKETCRLYEKSDYRQYLPAMCEYIVQTE